MDEVSQKGLPWQEFVAVTVGAALGLKGFDTGTRQRVHSNTLAIDFMGHFMLIDDLAQSTRLAIFDGLVVLFMADL